MNRVALIFSLIFISEVPTSVSALEWVAGSIYPHVSIKDEGYELYYRRDARLNFSGPKPIPFTFPASSNPVHGDFIVYACSFTNDAGQPVHNKYLIEFRDKTLTLKEGDINHYKVKFYQYHFKELFRYDDIQEVHCYRNNYLSTWQNEFKAIRKRRRNIAQSFLKIDKSVVAVKADKNGIWRSEHISITVSPNTRITARANGGDIELYGVTRGYEKLNNNTDVDLGVSPKYTANDTNDVYLYSLSKFYLKGQLLKPQKLQYIINFTATLM